MTSSPFQPSHSSSNHYYSQRHRTPNGASATSSSRGASTQPIGGAQTGAGGTGGMYYQMDPAAYARILYEYTRQQMDHAAATQHTLGQADRSGSRHRNSGRVSAGQATVA